SVTLTTTGHPVHPARRADFGRFSEPIVIEDKAPSAALRRALSFWSRLHGVLSLELAGQFTGMGFDPALLFAAELEDLLGP
ncbi:WHG domain-containing protein, partial [Streptomyces tendae]